MWLFAKAKYTRIERQRRRDSQTESAELGYKQSWSFKAQTNLFVSDMKFWTWLKMMVLSWPVNYECLLLIRPDSNWWYNCGGYWVYYHAMHHNRCSQRSYDNLIQFDHISTMVRGRCFPKTNALHFVRRQICNT